MIFFVLEKKNGKMEIHKILKFFFYTKNSIENYESIRYHSWCHDKILKGLKELLLTQEKEINGLKQRVIYEFDTKSLEILFG